MSRHKVFGKEQKDDAKNRRTGLHLEKYLFDMGTDFYPTPQSIVRFIFLEKLELRKVLWTLCLWTALGQGSPDNRSTSASRTLEG